MPPASTTPADDDPPEAAEFLDFEETRGNTPVKPWDPSKIRITTKAFSLRDVVDQIRDGDIDLAPDFQREYVWKDRQRTRLVESILLGIPLPAFYFNQSADGKYQVVDGVQRLSTIALFMDDQHALHVADLEYLHDLDHQTYSELPPAALRRFRSTQIVVHVIEPQTPDELKYDIFNRVNTLGSPLSPQEIRHAMSKPRSRNFIARLAESHLFDDATEGHFWRRDKETGLRVRDSGRMTNRELALRFCAFRDFSETEYRTFASLDSYLIEFTRRLDGVSDTSSFSDQQLRRLESDFNVAMANAKAILGRAAFRRWPIGAARRGPINRAVFEAQANALADFDADELLPYAENIQEHFRLAFDNEVYLRAVTVGTGDVNAVSNRLTMTREVLRNALP